VTRLFLVETELNTTANPLWHAATGDDMGLFNISLIER
jgi:hypothetical protein